MSSFEFDVSELNTLAYTLAAVGGRVGAGVAAVVRKTALAVEADGKVFAPVDTGYLRNSIGTEFTGDGRTGSMEAAIGPTANYGGYVEWGTSVQAPAAYMGPALDRHGPAFEAALSQLTEGLL